MSAKPVVLIGESLMVFNGPPDAPIDRGTPLSTTFAGAEVNVAIGLARLGHPARYVSAVGDDLFGRIILRGLRGEGVDVSHVQVSDGGPTGALFKSRRAGAEPEVFYYRRGSAISCAGASTFPPASWQDARVLYLTGITPALSGSCRNMVAHVVNDAHGRGVEVWFDPNHRRKLWSDDEARRTIRSLLPQIRCLLVGLPEGRMLSGHDTPQQIARSLLSSGPTSVVVKAGAEGSYHFDGRSEQHVPPFAIERVVDPIGAGDGFAAGYLSATLEGLCPQDALIRGNAVGALVCLTQGDWEGLPTRRELQDFLDRKTESVR